MGRSEFHFSSKQEKTSDGRDTGCRSSSLLAFSSLSLPLPLFAAMSGVRDLLKNLPARYVGRSAVAACPTESKTEKKRLGETTTLPSTSKRLMPPCRFF